MAVVIKVGETEAVSVDIGEKVYIQGDPGFSPIVEIEEIPRGHRITIISESGSQSFDVMDGDGKGITSIVLNSDYTLTIFYTDGTSWTSSSIRGETGPEGPAGAAGDPGTTFTPSVSSEGVISWANDGGKTNPQPVNIKGPQGPQGPQGPAVPLSDATPLMDDTATPGTGTSAARSDHRHPTDTTRAAAAELATYVRPNLLVNWYFVGGGSQLGYGAFPINQREQTIYSNSNAYAVDRWKLTDGSFTVASEGITLNGTIVQILPASVGLPVVASALLSDGTMTTPSYNDSTKTFTLTAMGQTIVAVKLEIGSTQTLAHQENGVWVLNEIPNYTEELAKCQAYYLHHVGYASVGFLADTGSAYVNIITPSTMAKLPTLEVVQYNNLIHGTTIEPITRANISVLRKNAVTVEVGVATTGAFELCMTADFMVNLSAE